jgi:hypothetical protein
MARPTKRTAKKPTRKVAVKRGPKKKTVAKKRAAPKKRSAAKKAVTRKAAVKKRVAVKSARTKAATKKRTATKKAAKKAVRKGPAKKRAGVKKTSKKSARKIAGKRSSANLVTSTPERPADAISAQEVSKAKDNPASIQTEGITELGRVVLGAAAFVAFVAAALTWVPA